MKQSSGFQIIFSEMSLDYLRNKQKSWIYPISSLVLTSIWCLHRNLWPSLAIFVATKPQKEMNLYLVIVFEAKNQEVISDIQNKEDLMKKYPDSVNIFHSWCDVCYNYYDYDRWLNLKSSEKTPEVGYEVQYKLSFEPYFLAEVSNCYWFTGHCPISGKLIHE